MRYLDFVQEKETVVHSAAEDVRTSTSEVEVNILIAEFSSNIPNMDVLQCLVRLQISDLEHKWVWTVGFAVDDQLSHHDSMVGSFS